MYLIKTTEVYRFDTDNSATNFIEKCKQEPMYDLEKYTSKVKYINKNKEDEETYYEVQVVKVFNDPKFVANNVKVHYTSEEI